jgi:glutathionyl-hydroquinone reductase
MGYLHEGQWRNGWYDTKQSNGDFVRPAAQFLDFVTADGTTRFPAESGRYHLYVSLACPWAHRTLIMRKLKCLEEVVSLSVVEPVMSSEGWAFSEDLPDHLHGLSHLHQLYTRSRKAYSGRVTVPVLWDKKTEQIVNNESADIVRMLNREFAGLDSESYDYYPAALQDDIDDLNAYVYDNVNNGVYRVGFAGTQRAYEAAVKRLFKALDSLEARLSHSRYLVGNTLTEADWRLFTTLIRFDAVYHVHFKCNLRRIEDHPNLSGYVRDLFQMPGIAHTVNFDHIKRHYYMSHEHINPNRIVPLGPKLDFTQPHGRGQIPSSGEIRGDGSRPLRPRHAVLPQGEFEV